MDSKNPPRTPIDPSFDPQTIREVRDPAGQMYDDPEAAAAEQRGGLQRNDFDNEAISSPDGTFPSAPHEEQSIRSFGLQPPPEERAAPLLAAEHADLLRAQWDSIQTAFVDEPRRAVEDADHLVAQAMARLAETFAQERANLEQQWAAARKLRPRICAKPFSATGRSSSGYCPSSRPYFVPNMRSPASPSPGTM